MTYQNYKLLISITYLLYKVSKALYICPIYSFFVMWKELCVTLYISFVVCIYLPMDHLQLVLHEQWLLNDMWFLFIEYSKFCTNITMCNVYTFNEKPYYFNEIKYQHNIQLLTVYEGKYDLLDLQVKMLPEAAGRRQQYHLQV